MLGVMGMLALSHGVIWLVWAGLVFMYAVPGPIRRLAWEPGRELAQWLIGSSSCHFLIVVDLIFVSRLNWYSVVFCVMACFVLHRRFLESSLRRRFLAQ